MKKNIVLIISIFSVVMYGMDKRNVWKGKFYGTTIRVTKNSAYDIADKVDILVLGKNDQQYVHGNYIFDKKRNKSKQMGFGLLMQSPVRYGRYGFDHQKNEHMEGVIYPDAEYCNIKTSRKYVSYCFEYHQLEFFYDVHYSPHMNANVKYASKAVKKELALEYIRPLVDARKLAPLQMRKIGIGSLGTAIGFPLEMTIPIAVKAICEFLKQNQSTYSVLHLFVKKQSTVLKYAELFEFYFLHSEIFD